MNSSQKKKLRQQWKQFIRFAVLSLSFVSGVGAFSFGSYSVQNYYEEVDLEDFVVTVDGPIDTPTVPEDLLFPSDDLEFEEDPSIPEEIIDVSFLDSEGEPSVIVPIDDEVFEVLPEPTEEGEDDLIEEDEDEDELDDEEDPTELDDTENPVDDEENVDSVDEEDNEFTETIDAEESEGQWRPTGSGSSGSSSTPSIPSSSDQFEVIYTDIDFVCYVGSRSVYSEIMTLNNTSSSQSLQVTLELNSGTGDPAFESNFTAGDIDLWVFTSEVDINTVPITETISTASYGSLTQWMDDPSPNGAIQVEVSAGVSSIVANQTGPFTLAAGESREVRFVLDCGTNTLDGETGVLRLRVEAAEL